MLKQYINIARPDHWFKNIFMLPGIFLAIALTNQEFSPAVLINILVATLAVCSIASANYTINEWLDAEFDRHHPVKKFRPSAMGVIKEKYVYLQWCLFSITGLYLSSTINLLFFFFSALLLIMGMIYNIKPFRTKDRQYLDVLSESLNNPLRFMLGWAAVSATVLPPSSVLLSYWMGGAYLMAIKRYAEYRFINDPIVAKKYRRSFGFYTEENLLLSSFFYALTSAFFLGVFLIKYRVEFIIVMPFLALLFTWYLKIGMQADSVTQSPEKLYTQKGFMFYVLFTGILAGALMLVEIPQLDTLLKTNIITTYK